MDANLDILATALYVRTDDLLKSFSERAQWRPAASISPGPGDANWLTLTVLQALLGFVSSPAGCALLATSTSNATAGTLGG